MPFPAAAVIAAAGSIASSYMSKRSAENMSNTSYQRAMKDMRKAGLNPILAYQQGGASTPAMLYQNPLSDVGENVATAKRVGFEKEVAESQVKKNQADAAAAEQNALTNRMNALTNQAQYNLDVQSSTYINALRSAQQQRQLAEYGLLSGAKGLQEWEIKGAEEDFKRRKYEGEQFESINRTIEKIGGQGGGSDLLRIIIQILGSRFGGSFLPPPGRR